MRPVFMIGSFPPPVGGAAMVNAIVHAALEGVGAPVTKIDVAGPRLAHSRGIGYHFQRLRRNLAGLWQARIGGSRDACLYIVPDAGSGAWYTYCHVAALAGRFGKLVLHHHSCRYIDEHSGPIAAIVRRTRATATHVFLTAGMAEAFQRRYGPVSFHVATNARFVAEEAERPPSPDTDKTLRIGHLSNLCADKGFFAVADAFDAIRAAGTDAMLMLGGPILEVSVETRLATLHERHGARVSYVGPVSGEAKRIFYRGLDLFLFPTQFRQEAAPLVVYEALSAGVPVLANDRGVIAEIIPEGCGAVCPRQTSFTDFVLEQQLGTDFRPEARRCQTARIKAIMNEAVDRSITQYDELIALLVGEQDLHISIAST